MPLTIPSLRPVILATVLSLAGGLHPVSSVAQAPGEPAAADPCVQGQDLYRAGRMREARVALLACLEQSGPQLGSLLPLTVMAVREGRPEEGIDFGGRAVELAPEEPEARYWFGRALLRAGRVEEARAQWEAGLQLSFDHAGILEGLARLALQDGQSAKAYNLLTQLQRLGVDDAWIHGLLAEIAAGKGLWAQALGHLQDAMARQAPDVDQLVSASELSILAGRREDAVVYCRRAVAQEPGGRTWGALGEAYFAAEEIDSALVWLRRAVAAPAPPARASFNLANALEVAELYEEAGAQFRSFLAANPDDAMGRFNYGIHLEREGRPEEALGEVRRAVALDPSMLNAYIVQAQILENLGRWDEALAVVGSLGSRDPGAARELAQWEERLRDRRDGADQAVAEGKVRLLHMVLDSAAKVQAVLDELAAGGDFADLAVRYSSGPAAAKGGDIGWIDPAQMAEPLRGAVAGLEPDEISPPVETRGLHHLFKRIR